MSGKLIATQCDDIRVHTYTAPDDGWHVNTHIIELPTQTIIVDAQYTLRYAREVVDYIGALGKPLGRLYITHYHPDPSARRRCVHHSSVRARRGRASRNLSPNSGRVPESSRAARLASHP